MVDQFFKANYSVKTPRPVRVGGGGLEVLGNERWTEGLLGVRLGQVIKVLKKIINRLDNRLFSLEF